MSTGKHQPGAQLDVSKERLRFWLRLLKVQKQLEAELRERLRVRENTTLPRFDVMAALSRSEHGMKMSQLSGQLRVSNGNVTGIVDRLAREGLVSRETVEGDRRAFRVRLTGRGREHFSHLAVEHESWLNDLLSGLPAEDARVLTQSLADLADDMDNAENAR